MNAYQKQNISQGSGAQDGGQTTTVFLCFDCNKYQRTTTRQQVLFICKKKRKTKIFTVMNTYPPCEYANKQIYPFCTSLDLLCISSLHQPAQGMKSQISVRLVHTYVQGRDYHCTKGCDIGPVALFFSHNNSAVNANLDSSCCDLVDLGHHL